MTIRTKTTLFVITTISVLVALIMLLHARTSHQRFVVIEDALARDDVARVQLQIEDAINDVSGTTADWAYWDDTYQFAQDANEEYSDSNLYAEAFAPIGIDLVVLADTEGTDHYNAWFGDPEMLAPAAIVAGTQPGGDLVPQAETDDVTGILVSENRPLLFASRNVLASQSEGPATGVLVMAREVTDDFAASVATLTNLDLKLTPCEAQSCEGLSAEPSLVKTNDTIASTAAIIGFDGRPAIRIDIVQDRTIYSEGQAGVKRVLFITLAVGFVAVLFAIVMARRILVGRLERLNADVAGVGRSQDHSLRVNEQGSDEIATLGQGINDMLTSLEQSQAELAAAKAATDRASDAKSKFLARVSHEVRNPLNGVLANAQLLEMDGLDGDQAESVTQILAAGRHIRSLLEEFLDIARIEAGAIPLTIQETSVDEIVAECTGISQANAAERGVTFLKKGAPDCLVLADPVRLRQVVLNLLSNAVKYGKEFGQVRITAHQHGNQIVIQVSDDGPGIAAEHLDRLFVPFDRLDADTSSVAGSGIGLVVTKQLVELMDGSLVVSSEPGEGACFSVSLPAAGSTLGAAAKLATTAT